MRLSLGWCEMSPVCPEFSREAGVLSLLGLMQG